VLAQQALFVPQDAGVSAVQQAQLASLVASAARSGYRIRLAVVGSTADLGSVTALWRRPQDYARFLSQELGQVYRGPLLVVMPDGLGLANAGNAGHAGNAGNADAAARSALSSVPRRAALGTTSLLAVQRLAAAAGHPLAVPQATGTSGRSSSDPVPAIVFALGCVLIGLAWAASFRARPWTTKRGLPRGAADPR
jgi:hypothetical protein